MRSTTTYQSARLPSETAKAATVAIIYGGKVDRSDREAVQQAQKPRIDILEMERELQAPIYDYTWLQQRASEEWITRCLIAATAFTRSLSLALTLRAFYAIKQANVIYSTGEDVGVPLAVLLYLLRCKHTQLVMRLEQPVYGRTKLRSWISTTLFRLASKRLNTVLCRTNAYTQLLRQTFGFSHDATVFLPETVDTHFYNHTLTSTPKAFQLPSEPYIVSAGLEMRDYETFIAAVRDLPVNVIIAAGSPWSQRTFNVSSELPENVQVQSFSATEMRDLYRSASVVVVPVEESPRSSGITVVLEAWAMKRPIVATRTAGLVSYIQDGMNGLLAEPNNPDDMRAKIQSILDNPGQAARLGENGYHTVIKKFYLDDFVSRVQSIVVQKAEQMRFST